MASFFEKISEEVQTLAEEALEGVPHARAGKFGIDDRAAWKLFAGSDFLAVEKTEDRNLQYYGGFEYIEKEHRMEVGGHVFYSDQDSRVSSCLKRFFGDAYDSPNGDDEDGED